MTITVNGRQLPWECSQVSYEDVVQLAFGRASRLNLFPEIHVLGAGQASRMRERECLKALDGMVFSAVIVIEE